MNLEKKDSPETLCSRCGSEANWRFLDEERQRIEIVCPDCGRFEVSRAELEGAEFEMVDQEEPR